MSIYDDERRIARLGLEDIERAISKLLESHPNGLRNSQIAELLNLRSDFQGCQKDNLTYSVFGGLVRNGKVSWDQNTKIFKLR